MRQPVNRRLQLAVKRAIDVVGAALLLVVTAPLMAVIAAAIKIESRGPVLFRQERQGLDGKPFVIRKFRTMVVGVKGHVLTLDDPRITRVGRFLRVNSLDELPQLLNVLEGDMSLVGPRPLPAGISRPAESRRLATRPGLTGLVEVSDPHLLDWDRRMKLDIWYVDHWSLWLDIRILVRTIPVVIGRKDAVDPPRTDQP
jgi:lipopolysaccharide/colanic/teichoic acid biosynthesis glycosyltransferase